MGTKTLNILNIKRDNLGRILVIEVKIYDSVFVLINIYNADTESEQLHTLNDLINILETFLNTVSKFSQLSTEQSLECEKDITEKELFEALKSMPNDKSPGNDGLTKEFFQTFWSEVKKEKFYLAFHTFLIKGNSAPHKDKQLLN